MLFFESEELGRTEEFLSTHYAPMRIAAVGEHARLQVSRAEADGSSVDRLDVGFELTYDASPVGRICLCDMESGTIEDHLPAGVDQRTYGPGDFFSFSVPDRPCRGRINRARYTITMFDPDVLGQVAGPTGSGEAHVLLDHRPAAAADAARLRAAINHFDRYVLSDPAVDERPLVVAAATQYIATLLLHTFPSTADLWPGTADSRDARSATVRRAIAYIEANASTPISPADIAAAAHVSVRALQLAFRRHLDTTPTAYLRQVRLEGARRDLVDGEPEGGATVAAIAARWGFAHQGRFGIAYRTAYGETPGSTLRGAEPVGASNGQGSSPYGASTQRSSTFVWRWQGTDRGDVDRESWAWLLSRAADELGAEHEEQRSAAVIVSLAREVVPHARHASLFVPVRRGRFEQRASTSPVAESATAAQLELGEGPCLEVGSADGPVGNARTALGQRWPAWGPQAVDLGVRSVLVVALRSGGAMVGALVLYAEEDAAFSDADSVELASLFAVHAAQAYDAAARIGGLEMALETRHLIGVAQGVLMLRYGLTIDTSFQLLRRTSSQTNVRLADIARQVADTGDLPRPREPGDDLL